MIIALQYSNITECKPSEGAVKKEGEKERYPEQKKSNSSLIVARQRVTETAVGRVGRADIRSGHKRSPRLYSFPQRTDK